MVLDYSKKGAVMVDMTTYTKETWEIFPEEMTTKINSPSSEHLFDVRDNIGKLEEKQRQTFHTIVSRSLFLGKHARPDIQPTVAFLCTRVLDADDDDWKKLKQLMTFLKHTEKDVLTLRANDICVVK